MSNLPKHGSDDYKRMQKKGKLIYELGEVILEQYGEKEAIKLLTEYKKHKDKEKKD